MLLGNKIDLPQDQIYVTKDEGLNLSKQIKSKVFYETSAYTGVNIEKAYKEFTQTVYDIKYPAGANQSGLKF